MSFFLLASIVSFCVYQFVSQALIKRGYSNTIVEYGGFKIWIDGPSADLAKKFVLACGVIIVIILTYIVFLLSDLAPSLIGLRHADSVLVGFLFGPLLSIWIGSIFQNPPGSSPTRKQGVALVGLLILIVFGAVGREAGRLIDRYSRNVSEVSALGLGVKFSLIEANLATRQQNESDLVFAPTPGQSALPPGASSSGLQTLLELDAFVSRDCQLIAAPSDVPEDGKSRTDFCSEDYFYDGDRFATARSFAKKLVSENAACLGRFYEYSADTYFVEENLKKLTPLAREIASPNFKNENFAHRSALRLYFMSADVTKYLYPSFFSAEIAINSNKKYKNIDSVGELERVGEACLPMIALACDINIPFSSKPASERRSAAWGRRSFKNDATEVERWRNFLRNDASRTKFQQCGSRLMSLSEVGDPSQTDFENIYNNNQSIRNLRIMFDHFVGFENFSADTASRPYVAIAYAGLSASVKNYEAAARTLTEWLNGTKSTSNFPQAVRQGWLEIRARSVLLNILEDWLRTLGEAAPLPLREQHVDNAERMTKIYERFLSSQDGMRSFFGKKGPVDLKGEYTVPYGRSCSSKNEDIGRVHFMYISMRQMYAFNVMRHPQYDKTYAGQARLAIEEVLRFDLSCISKSYGSDFAAVLRADALDLYARIIMQDIRVDSKKGNPSCTKACLDEAALAVKRARALIYYVKNEDDEERQQTKIFSKKISSSPVSDTAASLDRTSRDLDALTSALKTRGAD